MYILKALDFWRQMKYCECKVKLKERTPGFVRGPRDDAVVACSAIIQVTIDVQYGRVYTHFDSSLKIRTATERC